jgi:hypothetical protein
MNKTDIAVALYDTHTEAESSIKTLQQAGFDMKTSARIITLRRT